MATNPSLLIVPYRFKAAKLYSQLPESGAGDFTVTRSTTATRTNASGLLESVASGVPRLDYQGGGCPALLVEPAATNLALHSRDLTNAAWVKSNVTAAKTALGADAVASGATTLTASNASGTVLQTITSASSSRIFSAYVRRRTGTGTIQITQDNGTTWTTIALTDSYQRFTTPTGTITNPVCGFRIFTSGDAIDVDFTQQELGAVATSAISTTTATQTRNADVISVSSVSGLIGQTQGTIYAEIDVRNINQSVSRSVIFLSDGTTSNRIRIVYQFVAGRHILVCSLFISGVTIYEKIASIGTDVVNGRLKIAFAYSSGNFEVYQNGSVLSGATSGSGSFATLPSIGQINIGSDQANASVFNDRIRAAALYTTRLSNAELASLTTL